MGNCQTQLQSNVKEYSSTPKNIRSLLLFPIKGQAKPGSPAKIQLESFVPDVPGITKEICSQSICNCTLIPSVRKSGGKICSGLDRSNFASTIGTVTYPFFTVQIAAEDQESLAVDK